MALNLNHLELLHAVAAEGSISRGAERLLISQPAVSKQIASLERALGLALLERLPRGVRLTQAGEIVAGYANRIFALRDETLLAIEDYRGLRRGRLRIGASTSISVYVLPELIVRFRQQFPHIQIQLEVARSSEIEKRLIQGELDLGFTELFSGTELLGSEVDDI
jgi:DNA-binding transcriptional LysR family regulator